MCYLNYRQEERGNLIYVGVCVGVGRFAGTVQGSIMSLVRWSVSNGRRKEGNVLFNDTLNTFHLRLYCIGHMVMDHSDSARGNLLPPHGLRLTARVLLYASSHRQDSRYHGLCYTSRGTLARNNLMTHSILSEHSYHRTKSRSSLGMIFN